MEIRVYDDASDDGTHQSVKDEFEEVIIKTSLTREGLIALRNRGYADTTAKYVLSIDDDAWMTDKSTVSALVQQIDHDEAIAALAVPFVEARPSTSSIASDRKIAGTELKSFVGTAHLCRTSAVRSVGGYRELLVHQGEERDLCIRLRSAGWSIRMAAAPPIVHAVSPQRDRVRMHRYGVRNQLLFDCFYAPWCVLPLVVVRHVWSLLTYRRGVTWATRTLWYTVEGLRDAWRHRAYRSALTLDAYRSHVSLPAHGPAYVARSEFPPVCLPSALASPVREL